MKKQMTEWGVGPRFTIISSIYAVIILVVHYMWFPDLSIPIPRAISVILGIILLVTGLPLFLIPGLMIHKYFEEGKLATKGVYAYFRHPIYGSWIVFIIPGIVLLVNSLIGLTIPVVMYVVFKMMIGEEDQYLEEKFGEEYAEYQRKVGSIFPKFWKVFKLGKNK